MIIKPIDQQKNLFSVSQIVSQSLIDDFNKEDIDSYDWEPFSRQERLPRHRLIAHHSSALQELNVEAQQLPGKINSVLGTNFVNINVSCLYDLEGFHQDIHIDNPKVGCVLHFFIGQADRNHGTTWYNVNEHDIKKKYNAQQWHLQNLDLSVRHTFEFVQNTGYIQFNGKTQAHAPTTKVRAQQKRVSFYCHLS